jgi:hypothetical protein
MSEQKNLVAAGGRIASRNKRYVVWFYVLNLLCGWLGAAAFGSRAHSILDNSLYSDRLLHGFDLWVFVEMLGRPEFGPLRGSAMPAIMLAVLYFMASLILMPGVLLGYASDHRLPREEFYRACGHNIWRFVRLFLFFIIIAGILSGVLFAGLNGLANAADKTSYEKLFFFTQLLGTLVILVILTVLRIWFDLAQTNVVLSDQGAVRKSIASGFRKTRRFLVPLLASYLVIAVVALAVLAGGIVLWNQIVPPSSVIGAFIISQATLLLLLATRFWQRAVTVAFLVRETAAEPIVVETERIPVFAEPTIS